MVVVGRLEKFVVVSTVVTGRRVMVDQVVKFFLLSVKVVTTVFGVVGCGVGALVLFRLGGGLRVLVGLAVVVVVGVVIVVVVVILGGGLLVVVLTVDCVVVRRLLKVWTGFLLF